MRFPHTVRVESIQTSEGLAKGQVETPTVILASTAVLVTQGHGSRQLIDGQDVQVTGATITGLDPLLATPNIRFVILTGPLAGGTMYVTGYEPAGAVGSIPAFYRHRGDVHNV